MGKKRKRKVEGNRLLVLHTATELFAQNGLLGTSISDIAKKANLSKGTVSYYFPTKEHLIYEVNEYNLNLITSILFQWIEETHEGQKAKDVMENLIGQLSGNAQCLSLEMCMMFESMQERFGLKNRILEKFNEWQTMLKIGLMKTGLTGQALDAHVVLATLLLESLIMRASLGIPLHPIQQLYEIENE